MLPGIGGKDDAAEPGKIFNLEAVNDDLVSLEPPLATERVRHLETYSIAESSFFDCLQVDQYGADRLPLPPVLTPKIGLKFRTFDIRIEAKYGVRNYIREVGRFYSEIDENIASLIPGVVNGRDPFQPAIAVVKMYSEAHIYDLQVRRTKRGGRQTIFIRSLEPRPCSTRVIKADTERLEILSDYEESLLVLVQRELLIGKNSAEVLWALQPTAFTYHAMLRLWERGRGSGQTYHMVMAEAFERLRGITALVELCYISTKQDSVPPHIAVPLLDGFLVASGRHTLTESDELRWGFKRDRNWRGCLNSRDEEHFWLERYFSANDREYTLRNTWFAATYMGANDIGAWERSLAALQFNELVEGLNLDEVARYREWLDRSPDEPLQSDLDILLPDPDKVIALQREMLPREDAQDQRWHLLDL